MPTIAQIKAYVSGTMEGPEKLRFEEELSRNEDLRMMVEGYRTLQAASEAPEAWLERKKSSLKKPRQEKSRMWIGLAAAACIGALVIWGSVKYFSPEGEKPPYDFKDAGLPVLMGPEQDEMNAVMNAYKQNKMARAIELLENYMAAHGANDTTRYYQGVFAKEQGKYAEALEFFQPGLFVQVTLKQKAEMQRAICLTYLGRETEAKVILDEIRRDSGHLFWERAVD